MEMMLFKPLANIGVLCTNCQQMDISFLGDQPATGTMRMKHANEPGPMEIRQGFGYWPKKNNPM